MTLADIATANAISFEAKKDGLTQRQSGDWQLRLTVAGIDMNERVTQAPMGTRFACVLVEITDDETPVDHKTQERDKWRALGATKQAGIRCNDPVFWAFLSEVMFKNAVKIATENMAAICVREHCGVSSRSEFDKPGQSEARLRWYELDDRYQAWKAKENG